MSQHVSEKSPGRRRLWVLGWLLALAIALACDARMARWVHTAGIDQWMHGHAWFKWVLRRPGNFYFTLIAAGLVCVVHAGRYRAGALVAVSGILSGVNWLIKWIAGRARPYKLPTNIPQPAPFHLQPLPRGIYGLFHQSSFGFPPCFPSGDAALAFATAGALAALWPRWRWIFYFGASLVAAERIAENAHYLSDVVAGAILGILCAGVARRWFKLGTHLDS